MSHTLLSTWDEGKNQDGHALVGTKDDNLSSTCFNQAFATWNQQLTNIIDVIHKRKKMRINYCVVTRDVAPRTVVGGVPGRFIKNIEWKCTNRTRMNPPSIESSTRKERLDYVLNEWRCLHNCELCGKCHVLKGRSEEMLYADYIEGKRSYMDITLEIRNNR